MKLASIRIPSNVTVQALLISMTLDLTSVLGFIIEMVYGPVPLNSTDPLERTVIPSFAPFSDVTLKTSYDVSSPYSICARVPFSSINWLSPAGTVIFCAVPAPLNSTLACSEDAYTVKLFLGLVPPAPIPAALELLARTAPPWISIVPLAPSAPPPIPAPLLLRPGTSLSSSRYPEVA